MRETVITTLRHECYEWPGLKWTEFRQFGMAHRIYWPELECCNMLQLNVLRYVVPAQGLWHMACYQ